MSESTMVAAGAGRATWAPETNAWPSITALALGAVAIVLLSLQVIAWAVIPPVIIFAAVFAALAALCVRFGPRARWPWFAAAAGAVLLVVGNLPHVVEDLAHPETPFTFVPTGLILVLAVLALAGGLATALRLSLAHRPVLATAGAAGVLLLVVSGVAVASMEKHTQQPGDVLILVERLEFPAIVTASAGTVALFIDNRDRGRHTFVIDELGVHVELPGLVGRRVEFNAPPGEYRLYCDVPGHDSMEGILRVN